MSLSGGGYEKSVKGGTKSKLAAPKPKYVSHLLQATRQGDAAIGEVFRALSYRFKEPTWTVVFKALIITHMLIRDGSKDSVLDYLATSHQFRITSLTSTGCSPMSEQGPNILAYGQYLTARVKAFASVKTDYVKSKSDSAGQGRLRSLSVDKGLLRETESVQKLIDPLIKCKFLENDVDNDITLTAFRLLVADLLILFQVANEGVINVLEHYFEMSKPDAERALSIYQNFVEQTDGVIVYMSLARSLESVTHLEIPNLQHAPTSLGTSLEEYVRDPDFEQNRIQYLAQKEAGNASGRAAGSNGSAAANREPAALKSALKRNNDSNPFGAPQLPASVAASGNADLMDFFGSIEQPQQQAQPSQQYQQGQPVQQPYLGNPYLSQNSAAVTAPSNPYQTSQQQQQMTGSTSQTTNPYQVAPVQNQYSGYPQSNQQFVQAQGTGYAPANNYGQPLPAQSTGAGFGGYTAQPATNINSPFSTTSLQAQATGSNPFRKSMMPMTTGISEFGAMAPQRTGGNPFSRGAPPTTGTPLFATNPTQQQQQQQQQQFPSYQQPSQMPNQSTGNPFGHNRGASESMTSQYGQYPTPMQVNMTGNMMPQQTGTSNPFRKSMMPMGTGLQQQSYGGR